MTSSPVLARSWAWLSLKRSHHLLVNLGRVTRKHWARGTTSVDESRDFIKNAKQRKKDLVGIYEPDKKGKAAAGANSYTPAAGKKQQQEPYCTFCRANGHSTYACRKKAKQAKTTQEHATKDKPKM